MFSGMKTLKTFLKERGGVGPPPSPLSGGGSHPPALFKERFEGFHTSKHRISTSKHVLVTFGIRSKSVPKTRFLGSATPMWVLMDSWKASLRGVFGGRWRSCDERGRGTQVIHASSSERENTP